MLLGNGANANRVQFDAMYSDDATSVIYTVYAERRFFGFTISRTQLTQATVAPAGDSTLTFQRTQVNDRFFTQQGIYVTATVRDAAGNERTYSAFLDDTGDSESLIS